MPSYSTNYDAFSMIESSNRYQLIDESTDLRNECPGLITSLLLNIIRMFVEYGLHPGCFYKRDLKPHFQGTFLEGNSLVSARLSNAPVFTSLHFFLLN